MLGALVIRSRNGIIKVDVNCHNMQLQDVLRAGSTSLPLVRQSKSIILAAWLLIFALPHRTRADDRVDYNHEDYAENDGRIHVNTQGIYLGMDVKPWLSLNGNFIYDAISGATPSGAPPLPGTNTVDMPHMHDTRYAGSLTGAFKFGNNTLSPQVSYSQESDYRSLGISLNHTIEFNEKNTTLSWGLSHTFDQVLPNPPGEDPSITSPRNKDTTDGMVGISQLLDQNTILNGALTLGYSDGYLSDPYKRVLFDDFPYTPGFPYTVFPEHRPGHKFRQVVFLSLQRFFEPVQGAAELTYRFYHDDFGIVANTASIQWNQKIGKYVIISPLFRYHTQTAANFYATHFPGDPTDTADFPIPTYYSADYRLSALYSYTYGVNLSVQMQKHLTLDAAYKRYAMFGTDGVTAAAQYPTADVFTVGFTLWF